MRKNLKIIALILIIFYIIALINNAFAFDLDKYKPKETVILAKSPYYTIGGTVISIIRTIGIIVCVAVLVIVGIKFMYGSVEEKAEYKKRFMPIIVGAFFVVGTTTILKSINYNIDKNASISKVVKEEMDTVVEYFDSIELDVNRIFEDEYLEQLKEHAENFNDEKNFEYANHISGFATNIENFQNNYRNKFIENRAKKYDSKGVETAAIELDNILFSLYNTRRMSPEYMIDEELKAELEEEYGYEFSNSKYDFTYEEYLSKDIEFFEGRSIYMMSKNELQIIKELLEEYNAIIGCILSHNDDFRENLSLNGLEASLKALIDVGIEMKESDEILSKSIRFFSEDCDSKKLAKYYVYIYFNWSKGGNKGILVDGKGDLYYAVYYKRYMLTGIYTVLYEKFKFDFFIGANEEERFENYLEEIYINYDDIYNYMEEYIYVDEEDYEATEEFWKGLLSL